ncbi:MAG: tetratricopeptide repeat protein [Salibacteraceae bacterium]
MRILLTYLVVLLWCGTGFGQSATSDRLSNAEQVVFTKKYINADRARVLGDVQEAFRLYSECLEMDPKNDAVHYALARLFAGQNNLEQAAKNYELAHKYAPENEWYLKQLADIQAKQQDYKAADKTFKELRRLSPKNPEYIYNHASLMLHGRQTKKALAAFKEFEEVAGISPDVSIMKFQYLVGEEKFDLAIEELERALEAFPNQTRLYSYLADLYKAQGRYAKALDVFSKAMKVEPDNPYIQLSLAEYFERNKQVDSAQIYLSKAFANPNLDIDTKVSILLSKYPLAERDVVVRKELIALCKTLTETHPQEAKSHSVYGDFLYLNNDLEQARTSYYKAVDLDPSKFALWNQILVLDSELNDPPAMLKDSEKAMELFPMQPGVYLFNGIANNQEENYAAAAKSLKSGSQIVIGNYLLSAQLLASLGDAYHELKRYQSSDSAYSAALEYDSNNLYVLNNYSYFLSLRKEKLDLARKMAYKAVELAPRNASYLDTYGWVLYQLKEYDIAVEYLGRAIEVGGDNSAEVLEHYGDVLFQLGSKDKALEYWKKAKQLGEPSEQLEEKIRSKRLNE